MILGMFTGIAAILGGFMNWNFMMAGSASVNPVLFILAVLLVLAWKTAGWWGLDRWLLPLLGSRGNQGDCLKNQPRNHSDSKNVYLLHPPQVLASGGC